MAKPSIQAVAGALALAVLLVSGAGPVWAQADALAPLVAKLGPGDRDMLEASAATPDIDLVTPEGSANDALWSAMVKVGWMTAKPAPEGGPAGVKLKVFVLTPEGVKNVAGLLGGAGKP